MSAPSNSLQQPRVRRSNAGSPGSSSNGSCRLHPIRATVPYQLLRGGQGSPTRAQTLSVGVGGATNSRGASPPSSPTLSLGIGNPKQRLSPENKDSSCPPDSPVCRGKTTKVTSGLFYLTWARPRSAMSPLCTMCCLISSLNFFRSTICQKVIQFCFISC